MAQRDVTSTGKESVSNQPMKQPPQSIKLQTSLSQPAPVNPTNSQTTRRCLTLPVPLNHTYTQSPAELYIASRSRMIFSATNSQINSPSTPSSIPSSPTKSIINLTPAPIGHAEVMFRWRQKKANEICKKQKHRYTYGTPPSSSATTFSSPMCLAPMRQLNAPLPSQTDNTKSPIPPPRVDLAVKNEELTCKKTEKSKTNEIYNRTRISTAV